jgi:hypothetical protein
VNLRALFSLASLLPLVSCILFIDEPNIEAHCRFEGSETACGNCLRQRCQSEIDQACGKDYLMPLVDRCATGESCESIPLGEPFEICRRRRCLAVCHRNEGESLTHCTESFVSPSLACACDVDAPPNSFTCSSEVFPKTLCCAPNVWPGPALECACKSIACLPSSDGCTCHLTDNLDEATAADCRGTHCCAVEDRCQCRTRECSGSEKEVSACNLAVLECPKNQKSVKACSIRR